MLSKDTSIRSRLRDATAKDHSRLDALSSQWDIAQRRDYAAFLKAQAKPLFALEAALENAGVENVVSDWPQRRRRESLEQDLTALGEAVPEPFPTPTLQSEAEIFGTLYVLEGSRLGARFLLKRIDASLLPTAFLRHGEGKSLWPDFLDLLEGSAAGGDLAACIQSARRAFSLFEGSFGRALTAQTSS